MGKNSLAPGFRFHPTDVELLKYYLKRKILGKKLSFKVIAEVDIYKHAPWDLPDMSILKTGDLKWFFYCPIEKKYARGARLNRATVYGYWKITGKERPVKYNEGVVGMIKTLVFHQGKAPCWERTDWVMHEYRLEEKDLTDRGVIQDTYVLCVVFKKDGMGPRNGAQYGAPFKEEDWSDDEDANLPITGSFSGMPTIVVGGASSSCVPESLCAVPSVESSGLYIQPLEVHTNASVNVTADIDSNACASPKSVDAPQVPVVVDARAVPALMEASQLAKGPQIQESNDNILSMLEIFTEDDAFIRYDRDPMTGIANDSFFKAPQVSDDDDDILSLLASFTEDNNLNNVLYPFE
ncbi:NAC domain-containing protein 82-like [Durio zibethinus]|uniref:NAC domain-containing protein 82-like n=1 Tax=Durio zibethinus TaxID=66656 RepID=A0A6P5YKG4_DURZI|nr:NAC domain-containing protein 82-like [Durio zibethinus]